MLIHLLLLIPLSYGIFVFISSLYNPFVVKIAPLRRRNWRLGRAVALASLVAGTLAIVMLDGFDFTARSALATYLALVGLLIIPSLIQYRNSSIWAGHYGAGSVLGSVD